MISFESMYGEGAEVKENKGGGSNYVDLVPPTTVLADGTIEITDFVKGVTIKKWSYNEAKDRIDIIFEKDGATRFKNVDNPEKRAANAKSEESKTKMLNYAYKYINGIVKNYVYSSAVDRKIKDAGDMTFKQYAELLGSILEEKKDLTNNEVWLKVTFRDATGTEPQYTVPNDNWIGTEKFNTPEFKKKGDQYDDITNFEKVEKIANFDNEGSADINDVFSASSGLGLL